MITPMVARLVRDPFDREGWFFELKWDGFRAIAETDGAGSVKLYTADVERHPAGNWCQGFSIETQARVKSMQGSIGPYL